MIIKIADLLNELRNVEAARIEEYGVAHTTTIGDMYEGLTSSVLELAIPKQADLRVVSGFAETATGVMSKQMDCMIVSGSGRQLPYSKAFVWNIQDVIAVVEVKKTLFSTQLKAAYEQLRGFLELHWADFPKSSVEHIDIGPALKAYRLITGLEPPPHQNVVSLPFHLEMLYRSLVVDMVSPIRVIFGYDGFRSEETLREGFFDFLEKHQREPGFGGSSFPSLIVCGRFSLVKLNGLPFTTPMRGDRCLIYGTSHQNPLYFLLEFIWTRLSYRFAMPEWFMSDLTVGQIMPALSGKAVRQGTLSGWEYWTHSPELGQTPTDAEPPTWCPLMVSNFGLFVFHELCARGTLPQTPQYTGSTDQEQADFKNMLEYRIVGYDGDKIVLLTDGAMAVIGPDGNAYIGENNSGQLMAWVMKTFKQHPSEP